MSFHISVGSLHVKRHICLRLSKRRQRYRRFLIALQQSVLWLRRLKPKRMEMNVIVSSSEEEERLLSDSQQRSTNRLSDSKVEFPNAKIQFMSP